MQKIKTIDDLDDCSFDWDELAAQFHDLCLEYQERHHRRANQQKVMRQLLDFSELEPGQTADEIVERAIEYYNEIPGPDDIRREMFDDCDEDATEGFDWTYGE